MIFNSQNKSGYRIIEDDFTSSNVTVPEIEVSCKTKGWKVTAPLSDKIRIGGHADWQEVFQGGMMSLGGSALDTFNNIIQLTSGKSIQQPWMNRKVYKNTKPLSFSFAMNFVATYDPQNEVFEPAMKLLSFIFPRVDDDTESLKNEIRGTLEKWHLKGELINSFIDTFVKSYIVPGPSISWGNGKTDDSGKNGDAVTLRIGQVLTLGGVYLEDVDCEFSQACDSKGFPLSCRVNLKATMMDCNYVDSNGNFNIEQFKDKQADLSDNLQTLRDFFTDIGRASVGIVTSYIGYFKPSEDKEKNNAKSK